MQLSPLRLEDFLLKELRFALISPLTEVPTGIKYDQLDIEVDANTQMRGNDARLWRCEVTVRSKDEKEGTYPYTFQITYVGFFSVIDAYPIDRVEQMAKVNCPAPLYSAARETLLHITGRGRFPAVLLPSITFLEPQKAATKAPAKKPAKQARKK